MTGKDIIVTLSLNGTAIANTRIKSHDIMTQCPTIEVASATQQDWEEHIAGRKSWTLNISYLVLSTSQVAGLLYIGQVFGISMKQGNTTLLTGSALMTQCKDTFTVRNLCQGSFTLKGSGALATPT